MKPDQKLIHQTFRLPAELVKRVDELAAREHRSRNAQVMALIERGLACAETAKPSHE